MSLIFDRNPRIRELVVVWLKLYFSVPRNDGAKGTTQ
jgi:hypothetical protein